MRESEIEDHWLTTGMERLTNIGVPSALFGYLLAGKTPQLKAILLIILLLVVQTVCLALFETIRKMDS
jgi:hypothetical protein